jgi:Xaa-Pro aminopeptidase
MTARRRAALRSQLVERDVHAALVCDLANLRYLTGFTGSNGALLVTAEGADVLGTDGRYLDQAAREAPDLDVLRTKKLLAELAAAAVERGVRRLAVETHELSVDDHRRLEEAAEGVELSSLGRAVETLRRRKDDEELASLATACAISTQALEALLGGHLLGRTERQITRDLEGRMYDLGAEAIGFDTIVASGPNSAIPHHRPTDRAVEPGDLLKIDFGARFAGYHADCTRTFVVGREPQAWQREIYQLVALAQRAASAAASPGVELAALDRQARDPITEAGYGDRFTHGLGHGVGLQIHEDPYIGATATGTLDDRAAVTVEPGVYLPGRGGVRIEDTLVVTSQQPRLLTCATKDLLVVG